MLRCINAPIWIEDCSQKLEVTELTCRANAAISLAVALKLSLDETNALLKRAGYALSHAVKLDVIVEYFIANGKYDIFKINQVLFEYDQPLLGG